MEGYKFMRNSRCEYFPCHDDICSEDFNCLFCYCPLYALGEACGGEFRYTEDGIKDCSGCSVPHRKEAYEYITGRFEEIAKLAGKK